MLQLILLVYNLVFFIVFNIYRTSQLFAKVYGKYLTNRGLPAAVKAAEVDSDHGAPAQQIYWPKKMDGGRECDNGEGCLT